MLAIVGLGTLLGLAFNASNPVGIRFSDPSAAEAPIPAKSAREIASVTRAEPAVTLPGANLENSLTSTVRPSAVPKSGVGGTSGLVVTPGQGIPPVIAGVKSGDLAQGTGGGSTNPVVLSRQNPSATTWAQTSPILAAGKCVLVDARPAGAYEAGHIPGAISLPQTSTDDEVRSFLEKHGTNSHVVVYCSSTSCSLSFKLASRLVNDFKYQNVEFMTGGYMEWQRAMGLSVEGAATPALAAPTPSLSSPATAQTAQTVSKSEPILPDLSSAGSYRPIGIRWDEVANAFGGQVPQMVDIRTDDEFAQGHIDGAVRADLRAPEAEVALLLKKLGPDRPMVVYCEGAGCLDAVKFGTRLRMAGFKTVRYSDDGYRGWQNRNAKK
jgi:rhodanese-related sulfurtransferase